MAGVGNHNNADAAFPFREDIIQLIVGQGALLSDVIGAQHFVAGIRFILIGIRNP
jgi:hypothetical protein